MTDEPKPKFSIHDSRRLIAVLVLVGFLAYGGLQAFLGYLGMPDILKDYMTYLSALALSILTYYFGRQSAQEQVTQQQDMIEKQHRLLLQANGQVATIRKTVRTTLEEADPE